MPANISPIMLGVMSSDIRKIQKGMAQGNIMRMCMYKQVRIEMQVKSV